MKRSLFVFGRGMRENMRRRGAAAKRTPRPLDPQFRRNRKEGPMGTIMLPPEPRSKWSPTREVE